MMQQVSPMAGNRLDGFVFTYENTLSSGLSALTLYASSREFELRVFIPSQG
jgi:hypothetical protein